MNDPYAPCRLVEHPDGTFSLILTDFGPTAETFEAMGHEAGGYAWQGVVDALVRMRAPELLERVQYDPEGSMFAAFGKDREALDRVAELIRAAVDDPALLREAIERADPEMMD